MLKFGSPELIRSVFKSFVKAPATVINKNSFDLLTQSVRYTSFFNRLTGPQLWKGVTSVSNAGKKKGRGRGADKRIMRNLNVGQKIGSGKIRVSWPGLNTPVIRNKELQTIREDNKDEGETQVELPPIKKKRSTKIHPLERGWSGKQQRGKKIGPPDPIHDEMFEGFQSIVLEHKLKQHMSSVLGRKRVFFSVVATGNGKGAIGIGRAKSIDSRVSLRLAKTRASKRLLAIDLIENYTGLQSPVLSFAENEKHGQIITTSYTESQNLEYGRTKVFVFRKPEGFGLRCHRIIIALCQLVGIKNLHAKVEGSVNTIHMIRAFIVGLLRQKTYQEIADENKLHLVEFRCDTNGFPKVLASPDKCLTPKEALENPVLFEEYIMGGKLIYKKEKKIPFYQRLPSWNTYLKRTLYHRNHESVKLNLLSEYGAYESHLTKVYPECTNTRNKKKAEETST